MIGLNRNLGKLRRSQIRVYTNLANQTPGCIRLTIGEPDQDTPEPVRAAAKAALDAGLTHYAPNQGLWELRRDIARRESDRGHETSPAEVLVTLGATQALHTALTGILNPGEEVIIPTPGFVLYESIVLAAGAVPVFLDVAKTGFQITREALAGAITPRTKAILLNSPCNPTGVVFDEGSLAAVKKAALEKDIFIICDNVYQGLAPENIPDLSRDRELKDRLLVCQSFSKPWAMTGWRLGYLTGPEYVMEKLLLLSAATVASVPTFIQEAGREALRTDVSQMAELFRRRREYAAKRLRAMGLSFPEPQGAFYLFPNIEKYGLTGSELCQRMIREAKVAAVPGSCFGAEGYIRISCCCSDEDLKEGLDRLEGFLKSIQ